MKKYKIKAFTLVELIIVITILAILRTIGFISFQSYTSDARDGKRKTDLGILRNGLEIYQLKNQTLLNPDNFVTISGASIQGYAGINILKALRISDDTKDPKDKEHYTYSIDLAGKKYQLLAMLENNTNISAYNNGLINQLYARDYTTRFPYTTGRNFGIYLSGTTQTPVQEGNSGTTISNTGGLTLITSNTGIVIQGIAPSITASSITNSLCATNGQIIYTDASGNKIGEVNNDGTTKNGTPESLICTGHIVVCSGNTTGYVLQACNLGNTQTPGATNNAGVYGDRYQFGKTDTSWINGTGDYYSNDWKSTGGIDGGSANDWGVKENVKSTATWSNSDTTNQQKMEGPCPTDYHVPTNKEWGIIYTSWGGLSSSGTNLSNALKLPFAGRRSWDTGSMNSQGSSAFYWTSSPITTASYIMYFHSTYIGPNSGAGRATGGSIRCIKN